MNTENMISHTYQDFQGYVRRNLLDGDSFECVNAGACRASALSKGSAFYEGQMSYVGKRYHDNGTPMRIMFVGQESGRTYTKFSLADRYRRVHDELGVGTTFTTRNPHMRGNTLALRTLFDLDGGTEILSDVVGERFHLFDTFALVNALLCSAVIPGTTKGRATPAMLSNCRPHLARSVELLQPNIVIAQGAKAATTLRTAFGSGSGAGANLRECDIAGQKTMICELTHPSAWGANRWASPHDVYFNQVVRPTLLAARAAVG